MKGLGKYIWCCVKKGECFFFFFLVGRGVVVGFLTFQSVSLIVSFIEFCGFITFLSKVLLVLLSFF